MNCSKCNSKLKDGAKFCTSCGSPIESLNSARNSDNTMAICKECSTPLKPKAKFCTSCGAKTIEGQAQQQNVEELSVVKQRIFWNVQQGEIARKINEAEFIQYDSALGLIINDGTTAYIRSEGKQIAEIKGGAYNFIDPQELDKVLESRVGGGAGALKAGFKSIINIIFGKKVKDKIGLEEPDPKQQESLDAVIATMKAGNLLSLTLKLDKDFELIFGSSQSNINSYGEFAPMSIQTKYLDVNVGVRALFKITDFSKFSQHYLSDSNVVSTSLLADKLTPIIKAAVQEVMYDVEQVESRLPPEILDKIRTKIISSSNELMYGISLEKIVEIVSDNEDIERFRALSRELYLSEKELDYLNRTNDFKNRLASVTADQEVFQRANELELRKRLDSINKDNLLHEDELKKFLQALEINEIIRTAQGQEEIDNALIEIEKRGLLKKDEYNILADSVRKGEYDRELAFDLMQIKGDAERNRVQLEVEKAELERVRQQRLGIADIEVQEQKLKDDYIIDRDTRARSATMDLDERAADSSFERLRKIKELEKQDEELRHKQEMERSASDQTYNLKQLELKYNRDQNLTPQQLMAIAANENLDPAAAAEFAKSFSAGLNGEQQAAYMAEFNKLNQARIDDKDRDADRMERMMQEMMATARSMTSSLVQGKEEQKNEYKERLYRQEDRLDKTQDRALDYTTRNNVGAASVPPPPPTTQVLFYIVGANGQSTPLSLEQLQQLIGQSIVKADTVVYPSNVSSWMPAATVKEISHLFASPKISPTNRVCSNCGNSDIESGGNFCNECGNQVQ